MSEIAYMIETCRCGASVEAPIEYGSPGSVVLAWRRSHARVCAVAAEQYAPEIAAHNASMAAAEAHRREVSESRKRGAAARAAKRAAERAAASRMHREDPDV